MGLGRGRRLTLAVMVVCWSLWWNTGTGMAASRLKVAATIFPLYDLIRQVAGSDLDVTLLVPPGTSPHMAVFTPSTIRALTGSAVIFTIGHGLDDWAARLASDVGVTQTIRVDSGIALQASEPAAHGDASEHRQAHFHRGAESAVDPHYWLTIPNAIQIVRTITAALKRLDAAGQQRYEQRAVSYVTQLQAADADIRQVLAEVPRRKIAQFHAAFAYFAAAYGVKIVATFEPSPGREPGPRHVEAFLRQVQAHKLKTLFIEPQFDQAPLQQLARDLGITLKILDPLGGVKGREYYIDMMRFNAAQIASTLRD
jgi:ABC-type Zn uptake system ZnuABC Zn-binding protein ZnuA